MAKTFDFNKHKPRTMTVTLSDDEKSVFSVMTPDKRLRDELIALYEDINNSDEDEVNDALYELTAKVMSRNVEKFSVTSEQLRELYPDPSYVMAFLNAYVDFIAEMSNAKN